MKQLSTLSLSQAKSYCRITKTSKFMEFVAKHSIPYKTGEKASVGHRKYFRKEVLDEAILTEERLTQQELNKKEALQQ